MPLEPVFQHAQGEYTIIVNSTEARLAGFLDILTPRPEVPPLPLDDLLTILEQAKIKLHADVRKRLQNALAKSSQVRSVIVAQGKPAQRGTPGRIDWKIHIQTDQEQEKKVTEEQADYREVKNLVQVKEGDVLLEIIPPGKGLPGEDIMGREIPALDGFPVPAIRFGDNVRFDKEFGKAYAKVSGIVNHTGTVVSIAPIYQIDGDVAYKTGHVNFEGEVIIRGSVQDDFKVRGKKGITVHGSVYAAKLETDGDIRINEGVSGRQRASLVAGGKVQCKYLNAVNVVCRGDLTVSSEIINCQIRVGGRLLIPRGNIAGGDIMVRRGIEARQLGSPAGTPTRITVGVDVDTAQQRGQLQTQLAEVNKEINAICVRVQPHIDDPATILALPEEKQQIVKHHLDSLETLRQKKETLEAQLAELTTEEINPRQQVVKVAKMVYGKVTITIGSCTETFPVEVNGPVTFRADLAKGRLLKST